MLTSAAVIKEHVLTMTDMWVPVQLPSRRFEFQYKFQVPCNNRRFLLKPSTSNANCKITQQKREANCKTESRAIGTKIWYSGFTIIIKNIIVQIPLHAIMQIIQASWTHTHNMQIVHLAYDHHVLTVTCKSSI